MNDSKHWLDEASEADEFERSILRAGLEADPPQATQDRIWSSLMGALAVAPVLAVTAGAETASTKAAAVGVSSAGKASAVWLAVSKGFIVGLAVYGAAAGVTEISNRVGARPVPTLSQTRVSAQAPRVSAQSQVAPPTPRPALAPVGEDAPPTLRELPRVAASAPVAAIPNRDVALPSVASFDSEQPSRARESQLEGETRALRQARNELRSGKLADAFATLEASRRQFSAPELYQEREALMIELLFRSGQKATAAQRAGAFLSRFPESPHAQQVRQFAER